MLTSTGAFEIDVTGPGVVEVHPAPGGAVDLNVYGTTGASTVTITQTQPRYHVTDQALLIRGLKIRSGQLGALDAAPVDLEGKMTTLAGSMNTLDLGAIGPKAQVVVEGSVDSMSVSNIDLGPTGKVAIGGDINSIAQAGPMNVGAITVDGGSFSVGRDSLESIAVQGDVDISQDGKFSIGRDQDGTFTVDGSVDLSSGGQLVIGRNLASLTITGNLVVQPSGSGLAVNGALESMTVDGYILGQGGTAAPSAIDLGVGLNLSNLSVEGGISGQGSVVNANIRADGTISNVSTAYGTADSNIQSNATMPT